MISWAVTIGEMIDRLQAFQRAGATHVGTALPGGVPLALVEVQMELVFVDRDGVVTGTEAKDGMAKRTERKAVLIS